MKWLNNLWKYGSFTKPKMFDTLDEINYGLRGLVTELDGCQTQGLSRQSDTFSFFSNGQYLPKNEKEFFNKLDHQISVVFDIQGKKPKTMTCSQEVFDFAISIAKTEDKNGDEYNCLVNKNGKLMYCGDIQLLTTGEQTIQSNDGDK